MMFGLIKRSTHQDVLGKLAMAEEALAETQKALAHSYSRIDYWMKESDTLEARIDGLHHELVVLGKSLAGKVDQVTHYREVLQEIRDMATPACAHIGKRMAAKAEAGLQLYACVAEAP